jgi:8-oxo-dGTP pyrophosphatase MutT (NUDIX family)
MKMRVERSAGAIVFHRSAKGLEYLLLKHVPDPPRPEYWNFPKGHIEKGEKSEEAAKREVLEESGIRGVKILPGFKATDRYVYTLKGKKILKFVVWFLARSATKRVKISSEHADWRWLPYLKSYRIIRYRGTKDLLKKAEKFLRKRK